MNIVIPMAGSGKRFVEAGYTKPKPFIDVLGESMILRVLNNLNYIGARFILIIRREHFEQEIPETESPTPSGEPHSGHARQWSHHGSGIVPPIFSVFLNFKGRG